MAQTPPRPGALRQKTSIVIDPTPAVNLAMSTRMAHVDEQQRLEMEDHDYSATHASARVFRWWRSYSIEFRELSVYIWFLALYMVVVFGPSVSTMDR
jgi:UDP-N-acetylglucosamine 2-epimerase